MRLSITCFTLHVPGDNAADRLARALAYVCTQPAGHRQWQPP
jgi:hypothetical protein